MHTKCTKSKKTSKGVSIGCQSKVSVCFSHTVISLIIQTQEMINNEMYGGSVFMYDSNAFYCLLMFLFSFRTRSQKMMTKAVSKRKKSLSASVKCLLNINVGTACQRIWLIMVTKQGRMLTSVYPGPHSQFQSTLKTFT